MGRKVTAEGEQLARYAAQHGCTLKTARAHRAAGAESWQAFLLQTPPGAGAVRHEPDTVRKLAEVQADAWRHYTALVLQYDKAVAQHCGADTLGKFERAVASAQERHAAACRALNTARAEAGLLVPMERVEQFVSFLEPLGELWDSLRDLVGARIREPEAEKAFYTAFESVADEWDAQVRALGEKMQTVLPCF